jgi:uncharacterized protein (DUF305 family)
MPTSPVHNTLEHTMKTIAALAVAGAVLVAGCGQPTHEPAHRPSPSTRADHNDADVQFASSMIAHHQQALDMSALAATRAASPAVTDLAGRIEAAQGPEIEQLTALLRDWGQPTSGHGGHGGMPGMMSDEDMTRLEAATGAEFDTLFLELMIAHHEGAVRQATDLTSAGTNGSLRELAEKIITAQNAEITEMRGLLGR